MTNRRAEGTSELNRRLGGGAGSCCLRLLRCWRLWPGPRRKATGQRRRSTRRWNGRNQSEA